MLQQLAAVPDARKNKESLLKHYLKEWGGVKAFHFKSQKSYIHNILLHLIETILEVKAAIEFLQQLLTESSLYSIYIFLP